MDKKLYKPSQDEINSTLWNACDTFRGVIDPSDYKNYILVFMFLKYLSDVYSDKYDEYRKKFGDDKTIIERKMNRERFVLTEDCTFDFIVKNKNESNIGEIINKILEKIEDENKQKLEGVFRNIDFNSDSLGQTKDRNRRLKNLIEDFENPKINFRPSVIGTEDIIGNAYMYLIERFASDAGKKGGEFYTPHGVSVLLAKLIAPRAGNRICDPACGSASLLITVAEEVKDKAGRPARDFALYGQESNGSTWALAKMNMFLHSMDAAHIEWGDTLNNPKLLEGDALMQFDIVVANPPFSLDKWGAEHAAGDAHKRFWRGVPPKTKGDFAFITHMIETAVKDTGKVGVIVPHGVLFRGGSEKIIREKMVRDNLLEAVIGLPANLFFGTSISAAILIFNKGKGKNTDVLFVDASRDFEPGKRQNRLREQDIKKIVSAFKKFESINKYSCLATLTQIMENDFNLNIPRYVDTFEEEPEVDIVKVQGEIDMLEKELAKVQSEMKKYLKELNLS